MNEHPEALEPEPSQQQKEGGAPPWTLGDILICVVGGTVAGSLVLFPIFFVIALFFERPSDSVFYAISGSAIYLMVGGFVWMFIIKRRAVSWRDIGFEPVRPYVILLMIPFSFGLLFLAGVISTLTSAVFGDVPDASDQLAVTPSTGLSLIDLICLLIIVAIIGPVIEEMVFRGLVFKYVRLKRGLGSALFLSSLAFAATHFIPVLIPVFFVMGYAFGVVAEGTKSLYPAIAIHAFNNALSTMLVYWTFT